MVRVLYPSLLRESEWSSIRIGVRCPVAYPNREADFALVRSHRRRASAVPVFLRDPSPSPSPSPFLGRACLVPSPSPVLARAPFPSPFPFPVRAPSLFLFPSLSPVLFPFPAPARVRAPFPVQPFPSLALGPGPGLVRVSFLVLVLSPAPFRVPDSASSPSLLSGQSPSRGFGCSSLGAWVSVNEVVMFDFQNCADRNRNRRE